MTHHNLILIKGGAYLQAKKALRQWIDLYANDLVDVPLKVGENMNKLRSIFIFLFFATPLMAQTIERGPNRKWGIVDFDGEIIIPFEYDEIKSLTIKPMMIMVKDGLYGLVSDKGKILIPFQYDRMLEDKMVAATHRKNLFAVMKMGKIGMVDQNNNPVLPLLFDYAHVPVPNLIFGHIEGDSFLQAYNTQGKFLYKIPGKIIETCRRCKGIINVQSAQGSGPVTSYKLDGTLLPLGSKVYTNGYIINQQKQYFGITNTQGDWLIPCEYKAIYPGVNGQYILEKNDTARMVIDINKHIIVPMGNWAIEQMGSLYKVFARHTSQASVYDSTGLVLLSDKDYIIRKVQEDERFSSYPNYYPNNYFLAVNSTIKKVSLYQKNGTMILPPEYDGIQYCSNDHPLLCVTITDKRKNEVIIRAFDFAGKQILPDNYLYLEFTANPGLLIGSKDNRTVGFVKISDLGSSAVFEYDSINYLPENYFGLCKNGLWQLFSPEGAKIGKSIYVSLRAPDQYERKYFPRVPRFKGKLVAIVQKTEMEDRFVIGISDRGREYKLDIEEEKDKLKKRNEHHPQVAPEPEILEAPYIKNE